MPCCADCVQYASDLALAVAPPPAALPLRWQAPLPPAGSPRPPHTSRPSIQRPCSGPRLTMPHPPLPGIVPRPLHTAPSPALDAAGHQPSSPPPPPPPFPRRASGHPVVPVRWAYLLVSSPERAHTHTLNVTSPAMSCNVHAVWTSEQSHCRTSLNAAHSALLLKRVHGNIQQPKRALLRLSRRAPFKKKLLPKRANNNQLPEAEWAPAEAVKTDPSKKKC